MIVTKRTLLQMGFEKAGLPGFEFNSTPEEITSGLRALDAMMSLWLIEGIDVGYLFPDTLGDSLPDDDSGVPAYAVMAIAGALAFENAPGLGKSLSREATRSLTLSKAALRAKTAIIPRMILPRDTLRGSGNGRSVWEPYMRDCATDAASIVVSPPNDLNTYLVTDDGDQLGTDGGDLRIIEP